MLRARAGLDTACRPQQLSQGGVRRRVQLGGHRARVHRRDGREVRLPEM